MLEGNRDVSENTRRPFVFSGLMGHAEAKIVLQKSQLLRIFRIPDPGDGVFCSQLFLQRQQDELISSADVNGNQQIGRLKRRPPAAHLEAGAVARDGDDVNCLGPPEIFGVAVNNGDVMAFGGKLLDQCVADFAVSHYDDFHTLTYTPCQMNWDFTLKYTRNKRKRQPTTELLVEMPRSNSIEYRGGNVKRVIEGRNDEDFR
jgi:hypothetical protein